MRQADEVTGRRRSSRPGRYCRRPLPLPYIRARELSLPAQPRSRPRRRGAQPRQRPLCAPSMSAGKIDVRPLRGATDAALSRQTNAQASRAFAQKAGPLCCLYGFQSTAGVCSCLSAINIRQVSPYISRRISRLCSCTSRAGHCGQMHKSTSKQTAACGYCN